MVRLIILWSFWMFLMKVKIRAKQNRKEKLIIVLESQKARKESKITVLNNKNVFKTSKIQEGSHFNPILRNSLVSREKIRLNKRQFMKEKPKN